MRTFIDLFSGAGLFSAGFVAAGFRPLLAVDADLCAVQSYNRNVAPVAIDASVEEVISSARADLIIAGPPCQGFSTLGTRNPTDIRNRLCLSVVRWAVSARASIVVVENVPQFVESPHWQRMVASLRREGFEITTWCLDAADFGTPQHRVRSFTIASRIGLPAIPTAVGAVHAGVAFRPVRDGDPMHVWPKPTEAAAERIALIPRRGDWRDIMRARPELCPPSWFRLGCQATDIWGRIDARQPANTLKTRFQNPSTGRYLHPTKNRVVSLREGARLQGAPDTWSFVGNTKSINRQIGNGVPIPLAAAVGRQIKVLVKNANRRSRFAA